MAGKRKRDQADEHGGIKPSKKNAPQTIGNFVIMPLQYPSVCNLKPTLHYMYLRAHSGTQDFPKHRTLFVVNIPPDAGESELRTIFSHYGVVERVLIRGVVDRGDEANEEDGDEEGDTEMAEENASEEVESDDSAMPKKKKSRPVKADAAPVVTPLPPRPPPLHQTGSSAHVIFLDASSVTRSLKPPPTPMSYTPPPLTGLSYYLAQHKALHPPLAVVKEHADSSIEAFDYVRSLAYKASTYKKGEAIVDEDGFTLVTRGGKYGQAKGGGVGIASKSFELSTSGNKVEESAGDRRRKKKARKAEAMPDFYRFQQREKKRQRFNELRENFQRDKEAVMKMRESRKFKPY